jgi:hypothetical protein
MVRFLMRLVAAVPLIIAFGFATTPAVAAPVDQLAALVPAEASGLLTLDVKRFQAAARAVDEQAVAASSFGPEPNSRRAVRQSPSPAAVVQGVLETKRRVDELLDRLLALRTTIISIDAEATDDARRRIAARGLLGAATTLIDLSGRLRYLSNDVIRNARTRAADAGSREQLADIFLNYRSTVGAAQSAGDLFTTPGRYRYHEKLLRLIAASGQTSLLPTVVDYVEDKTQPTSMRMFAVEIIRAMGLPQQPRPDPVEKNLPEPTILADELHALVAALDDADLDADGLTRKQALLDWLDERRKQGFVSDRLVRGAARRLAADAESVAVQLVHRSLAGLVHARRHGRGRDGSRRHSPVRDRRRAGARREGAGGQCGDLSRADAALFFRARS